MFYFCSLRRICSGSEPTFLFFALKYQIFCEHHKSFLNLYYNISRVLSLSFLSLDPRLDLKQISCSINFSSFIETLCRSLLVRYSKIHSILLWIFAINNPILCKLMELWIWEKFSSYAFPSSFGIRASKYFSFRNMNSLWIRIKRGKFFSSPSRVFYAKQEARRNKFFHERWYLIKKVFLSLALFFTRLWVVFALICYEEMARGSLKHYT